jgi:hypothetical protein
MWMLSGLMSRWATSRRCSADRAFHQADAVLDGVGDGEMQTGIEHPLQRRALVPGLQVVEAAASFGG